MRPVGEQVVFRSSAHRFRQALAELTLQETHDLAHSLERESALTQFADHCYLGEILHRVQAPPPGARRNHNAALIPPLQLPGCNSCKRHHLAGCELCLHRSDKTSKTTMAGNV